MNGTIRSADLAIRRPPPKTTYATNPVYSSPDIHDSIPSDSLAACAKALVWIPGKASPQPKMVRTAKAMPSGRLFNPFSM